MVELIKDGVPLISQLVLDTLYDLCTLELACILVQLAILGVDFLPA